MKSCIILAPHLEYPLRNGADIYVEKISRYLSIGCGQVSLLGTNTLTNYENGTQVAQEHYENSIRSKYWAAMRTLVFRTNYLAEKFLTPAFKTQAEVLMAQRPNDLLICSLTVTASFLKKNGTSCPIIILTENDEVAWFRNQRRHSHNPLQKLSALFSEQWSVRFLRQHAQEYIYIHITEADQVGYEQIMPGHRCFVVPAGVNIENFSNNMPWDGIIRLLFVGSLSVKMSYDALFFFQKRFWPVLKDEFGENIEMTVLGSRPSMGVRQLCRREKWKLLADASEEKLYTQYGRATFAVLPFPYTTGAKLKLLSALAVGLPVLCTTNMKILPGQEFAPNLYSDEPREWRDHLNTFNLTGITSEQRASCQHYASQYSWEIIAADMARKLCDLGV